jgi:hypothetical protein
MCTAIDPNQKETFVLWTMLIGFSLLHGKRQAILAGTASYKTILAGGVINLPTQTSTHSSEESSH